MIAAILKRKTLLLRFRAVELAPLAVSENDLITTGKNLKWFLDLVHLIEVHRPGFVEVFELRWVNEVTHLDTIYRETQRFDCIGTLVGIDQFRIGTGSHQVDGRIDQHLNQFMRC